MWHRFTGDTGQCFTAGCLQLCVIGSPSCLCGFWLVLSSQPCGTLNVKKAKNLGRLSQMQSLLVK